MKTKKIVNIVIKYGFLAIMMLALAIGVKIETEQKCKKDFDEQLKSYVVCEADDVEELYVEIEKLEENCDVLINTVNVMLTYIDEDEMIEVRKDLGIW